YARPTLCRAACVPYGVSPCAAYAASAQPCSPVKRCVSNGKLCFMVDASLFPALETLLAVSRTGSVGAAARQRHITSSAVSQQVRRLETHFGIKFFERAGRGIRLTTVGEAALPVVRELWSGAELAFGQPFAWVGPRRGPRDRQPRTDRLRREPVLRLAAESRGRAVLDQYLTDERIRPVSTIDVPSVSLLLSYVSGGLGIGLVPALALAEAPMDRVVRAPARVPSLPVTLVWRATARRQPALARLADLLATAGARADAKLARRAHSAVAV